MKQEDLTDQIEAAFEPFRRFTSKATQAFTTLLGERSMDINFYIDKRTGEIATKKMEIQSRIQKIDQLHKDGTI